MARSESRINELIKRQVYYSSSLVVKLRKVNGVFLYDVYAWFEQGKTINKSSIISGKYENQDPEELFKLALNEIQVKKIKLGVVLH